MAAARWAFMAEWVDPHTSIRWTHQLFVHGVGSPGPLEVEMFDVKNRRHFLKRVKYEPLREEQLFVGSTVVIFSRALTITGFGDEATRAAVEARSQRAFALIAPAACRHVGTVLGAISASGLSVANMRMCRLAPQEAAVVCALAGQPDLAALLTSGPVVALELRGANGVQRWLELLGSADEAASQHAPGSICALLGRDAALGCGSPASAAAALDLVFGGRLAGSCGAGASGTSRASSAARSCGVPCCARCLDAGGDAPVTLGLIKPHAVAAGVAGAVLDAVAASAGLLVTGLALLQLDQRGARELLEVYRGVVPAEEYTGWLDELASGPCIALEVASSDGASPVEALRALAGPHDPELGRLLRPGTLRARFGTSVVCNALHATDLEGDGTREAALVFGEAAAMAG